jgi:hypothetical protein
VIIQLLVHIAVIQIHGVVLAAVPTVISSRRILLEEGWGEGVQQCLLHGWGELDVLLLLLLLLLLER